ncbi:hypothetical protein VRRI112168_03590 [Vreelandella rituensis]|uniref:Uncharacterized protein n=1 Tax=Vreelandella rituensis TaxID=2282306 RepID=A0A368UAS2_9GAMM|nr:hypothetical protein [Halomonas rituensis]RCV93736.1 hypothetical protein DU506_00860 [Halomonas rituensis]
MTQDIHAWHLDRLHSLMDQWRMEDGTEGLTRESAEALIEETADNGRLMGQISRLQGGLSKMRDTLLKIIEKPALQVAAIPVVAAAAYVIADVTMVEGDLEYMRDMAAITQAEFAERIQANGIAKEKVREVVGGLMGLAAGSALALNADRVLALATGLRGHHSRLENGVEGDSNRLYARLTDSEREALSGVIRSFSALDLGPRTQEREALISKLLENVGEAEQQVSLGDGPANLIETRLGQFQERLDKIQAYSQKHDKEPGVQQNTRGFAPGAPA